MGKCRLPPWHWYCKGLECSNFKEHNPWIESQSSKGLPRLSKEIRLVDPTAHPDYKDLSMTALVGLVSQEKCQVCGKWFFERDQKTECCKGESDE